MNIHPYVLCIHDLKAHYMTDAVQMGNRENGLVIITGGSGRLWKAIGCYSYPRARGMWFSLNWEQWGWGECLDLREFTL